MFAKNVDDHFEDHTVVITGASGGIGRQTALRFAQAGARVILHANKNVGVVTELAGEIRAFGGHSTVVEEDFSRPEGAKHFVETVYSRTDQVDVWVNAAGVDLMTNAISNEPFCKKLRKIFEVDVFATLEMSHTVGQRMFERQYGTIFFFSWNGVHFGWDSESAQLYGAAKGSLIGYSRSLAERLAPHVRIRCLSLGWIRTIWGERTSDAIESGIKRDSLQNRWGTPDEVADAVLFLASPASAFVDGIDIRIDGGKRGTR